MLRLARRRVDALDDCRRSGGIGHDVATRPLPLAAYRKALTWPITGGGVVRRVINASLGTQLFLLQMVIVLMAVGGTAGVWVQHTRNQLAKQYQARALVIAESVAALPEVRRAFSAPRPELILQPIAMSVQRAAGADYVVIANRDQIRYTHPNVSLIGKRLSTDGSPVLRSGEPWTGVQTGTLG